jgi:hypothetical protein
MKMKDLSVNFASEERGTVPGDFGIWEKVGREKI